MWDFERFNHHALLRRHSEACGIRPSAFGADAKQGRPFNAHELQSQLDWVDSNDYGNIVFDRENTMLKSLSRLSYSALLEVL